jgi:hypothetical protein
MKPILLSIILFFATTICSQKVNTAIVAFYNFENLYDTIDQDHVQDEEFTPAGTKNYKGYIYIEKLAHLDDVVSLIGTEFNPDGAAIIGTAEIENKSVLKDFVKQEKVKNRNYQIVHYDSKDARGVDVALLYNPKYFKVINSQKIYVDLSSKGESSPTRDILWVKGMLMGEIVHVFVNHWPSRRGGEEISLEKRCLAASFCRKVIDSIQLEDPLAKIIVMGDLNDDPNSPSVTDCLKALGSKEKAKDGYLYNPFLDYYSKGIGTLAYNDSWNLFDQIMVSEPFLNNKPNEIGFKNAYIFSKSFMTNITGAFKGYPLRTYVGDTYAGGYSDHFPTYIVLTKKITE